MTRVAVVDIGKTNAKLALVDLATLAESGVRRAPNTVLAAGPYPHFDTEALWGFILDGLAAMHREAPFEAIAVTTHGASAALLRRDGTLAMPVLDYEHDGPGALAAEYDALRPPFAETGSPRLPVGLNLGAQLFWQARMFPVDWAQAETVLPLPQYWSHRLSGTAASEATSLGTHTDLWNPHARRFSSLVGAQGWREKFPPLRRAGEPLGMLRPDLAAPLGLPEGIAVLNGIHDSNASLYPHLLSRRAPFSVVSTGTWVVGFAVGGSGGALDPTRDTLVNVDARGAPVPSARFMGGREFALVTEGLSGEPTASDLDAALSEPLLLLPAVQRGSGPFPDQSSAWLPARPAEAGRLLAAASFYLASMTAASLDLIGAAGPTVVEGPFATNEAFLLMLAAASRRPVAAEAGSTGTSIGAALLAARAPTALRPGRRIDPPGDPAWGLYAARWRAEAERRRGA